MPAETIVESSPCNRELRVDIENFFSEVSGRLVFKDFGTLLAESTLSLVRTNKPSFPFITMHRKWGHDDESALLRADIHKKMKVRMAERQRMLFATACPTTKAKSEVLETATRNRCGMIWRDLVKYAASPMIEGNEFELPRLIDALHGRGLTSGEAELLQEKVANRLWEAIPENYIDLQIGSQWEYEFKCKPGRNYEANDEIDRWRAAVALARADLFITDGYVAQICRHPDISRITKTAVYSVAQRCEILDWLGAHLGGSG